MNERTPPALPSPFELLESARTKYTLAQTRVRHGPPELALLSLHGSLEDVLRAHGFRLGLPEASAPFPHLLVALTKVPELPLSEAEAHGIRRMHEIRARVAHGEGLAMKPETLVSYQRLIARLLSRYGVVVVPPAESELAAMTATTIPGRPGSARPQGETQLALERAMIDPQPRPVTQTRRLNPPPPERAPAPVPMRYPTRAMPSGATRDLPLAQEMLGGRRVSSRDLDQAERFADFWGRSQAWLLPTLIIVSIFLIGLVISASLQQMRAMPVVVPTAIVPSMVSAPPPAVAPAAENPSSADVPPPEAAALTVAPIPTQPSELAIGVQAYVRADVAAVNVRTRPGLANDSDIVVSLEPGSLVELIGGPIPMDGYTWWEVRAAGNVGWSAGELLEVR